MRSPRRILSLSLLSAVLTAMFATTLFTASLAADPSSSAAPRPSAALVEKGATRAAPADVRSDAGRYAAAERDAAAKDAREFKGGAAVVIVGSTAALVLGIILLIVLL